MTITSIETARLTVSARNVRKTSTVGLEALKADIAARGVLQNLIAIPTGSKRKQAYEIVAGARRLAAVKELIAEGLLPADYSVPVLVLEDSSGAAEASLAENFQRANMNPADECLAFRHFTENDGSSVEEISKRFGVSNRFIEGRLRLANLAEPIFEALRNGEITLDVAQAFGSTADPVRQQAVWERSNGNPWDMAPDRIRRSLQTETINGSSGLARFVGEAAYVEAGGRVERDLFGSDDSCQWLDVTLAEQLAEAKLAAAAEATKAVLGVGAVIASINGPQRPDGLEPVYGQRPALSDEEQEHLDSITAQIEALEEEWMDEDMPDEVEQAYDSLAEARDAILDRPAVLDPEVKARATAILVIDRDGCATVHSTLFAPPQTTRGVKAGADASRQDGEGGSWDTEDREEGRGPALSDRLADELAHERASLLQLGLATNPDIAMTVLAFYLADAAASTFRFPGPGFDIRAHVPTRRVADYTPPETVGGQLTAAREWLKTDWSTYKTVAERFEAFRAGLSASEQAEWVAWVVAQSIEKTIAGENSLHDQLGELMGLDSAALWRPTAANYFGRVRKDVILDTLEEVGGKEFRGRYASAKKGDLAAAAERIFSGDAIIEPDIRARAVAWVPAAMRFGARSEPEANPEDANYPAADDAGGPDDEGDPYEADIEPLEPALEG
jgi:ParB family chromosome partitioning protein